MVGGGVFPQPDGKLLAVVDQHRAEAHQLLIELRQGGQQVRPLISVPQNTGLVVIGPVILRQSGGISGSQLT